MDLQSANHLFENPKLQHLKQLHMAENRLYLLPPTLGLFRNLNVLNLESNELTHLPPEISCLSSLKRLYLYNNVIRTLPSSLGDLVQLERLFLDRNRLVSLPAEIGRLTNLMWLSADQNQLELLPEKMGDNKKLRWLSLDHNKLIRLPGTLVQCEALDFLSVVGNPRLLHLDHSLLQMKSLHDIRVDQQLQLPPYLVDDEPSPVEIVAYLERIQKYHLPFDSKGHWIADAAASKCSCCGTPFSLTTRRHHCRLCGNLFCKKDIQQKIQLPVLDQSVVCARCYDMVAHTCPKNRDSYVYRTHSSSEKEARMELDELFPGLTEEEKIKLSYVEQRMKLETQLEQIKHLINDEMAKVVEHSSQGKTENTHERTWQILSEKKRNLAAQLSALKPTDAKSGAGASGQDGGQPGGVIKVKEQISSQSTFTTASPSTLGQPRPSSLLLSQVPSLEDDDARPRVGSGGNCFAKPTRTESLPLSAPTATPGTPTTSSTSSTPPITTSTSWAASSPSTPGWTTSSPSTSWAMPAPSSKLDQSSSPPSSKKTSPPTKKASPPTKKTSPPTKVSSPSRSVSPFKAASFLRTLSPLRCVSPPPSSVCMCSDGTCRSCQNSKLSTLGSNTFDCDASGGGSASGSSNSFSPSDFVMRVSPNRERKKAKTKRRIPFEQQASSMSQLPLSTPNEDSGVKPRPIRPLHSSTRSQSSSRFPSFSASPRNLSPLQSRSASKTNPSSPSADSGQKPRVLHSRTHSTDWSGPSPENRSLSQSAGFSELPAEEPKKNEDSRQAMKLNAYAWKRVVPEESEEPLSEPSALTLGQRKEGASLSPSNSTEN